MEALTVAVLPADYREMLEGRLPPSIEPLWWETPDHLEVLAPQAEIGWFDLFDKPPALRAIASAGDLRWLNTGFAGVDWISLDDLDRRGITLTNGSGLNSQTVAEFTLMGMIAIARDYRAIVRSQDACRWIEGELGSRELAGSRALLLGYGSIGQRIGGLLEAVGVETVAVRSKPGPAVLGPDDWRARLREFDWIVLSLPATDATQDLIGRDELAAMKPDAVLVNVGRAETVQQNDLIEALRQKRIAAALLDLTDPEPLPPDHPLWNVANAHVTMHRAGRPTPASRRRAADRFAENCDRFLAGLPLEATVDLHRGY